MARLIDRIGPIRHRPKRVSPFESLAQAIVYQQLNGKAARTIFDRVLALFGSDGFPSLRDILATPPADLRGVGLSQRKTEYIIDLARKTEDGLVPSLHACDRMPDADLIDRLTAVKGIGRWTVEMMLIFNLGRPDVLPVQDLGIRRGFQMALGKRRLPDPERLARHGERWAPHRTTAALYLWRAVESLQVQDR